MQFEIRPLTPEEYPILEDFLYEAIFIPEGVEPPTKEIIEQAELKLYYDGFGTGRADYCIVADDNGKVIGAVW
ncbi:MAG: GNAT family N-acetyltransferase, partial [Oscillospiraceae bacterium]|nr:GNAT family N-acetyltransferase [Oscillospiraceae bacterium]